MDERVVFGHSIEALLRTLDEPTRTRLTPELTRLGLSPGKPWLPAYPLETYIALLDLYAAKVHGNLGTHAAFVEVGRAFMRGYGSTMMGKALLALMRVAGPRRALERLTRNLRTANNYSEAVSEKVTDTSYRVRCTFVLRPGFYQGILEHGLELAGGKNVTVTCESEDAEHRVVYLARWD